MVGDRPLPAEAVRRPAKAETPRTLPKEAAIQRDVELAGEGEEGEVDAGLAAE